MEIALVTQKIIKTHPGSNVKNFELPSEISRYFEFDNSVVFLLYDDLKKRESKIIGVQFSKSQYSFFISWEFQIKDGLGEIHEIVLMERKIFNNKEVIYCYGWGFDIGYYLEPDTGKILHTEPIK